MASEKTWYLVTLVRKLYVPSYFSISVLLSPIDPLYFIGSWFICLLFENSFYVIQFIRFLRFHLWHLHLAIQILLCVFQERRSLYLTGQPPHPLMLQTLECLLSQSWKLSSSLQSVDLLKPWLTPTEGGKGLFGLNCYITVCPGGESQQEPGDRSWSQCRRGGLLTGFLCTAYSAWFFIQVNTSHREVGPPTSIINSEYAPQTCLQPIQWQQFLKWSSPKLWFESS